MPKIVFPSEFLKININTKHGDLIKFKDAGTLDEETERYTFVVSIYRNGEHLEDKKFTLNKTNFKAIAECYGDNSDEWVGKEMEVNLYKTRNPQNGAPVDSILLTKPSELPI